MHVHLRSSLAKALAYEEHKIGMKKIGREIDLSSLIKSIGSKFGLQGQGDNLYYSRNNIIQLILL